MTFTLIGLEQSFDPGFTLRVVIDRTSMIGYIVDNKTKAIVRALSVEIWEDEPGMVQAAARGSFDPIRSWIDKHATAYQFHVGWRTPL